MRWALGLIAAFGVSLWLALDRWVAATDLPPLAPATAAEVLAEDGTLLRAYTVGDGRWRLAVDTARVDQTYLTMLLAYEDQRFYRHSGVDPVALARALWQSALAGRLVSGGSTLTMQLARLLEDGPTGTWAGKWAGKWRQIRLAWPWNGSFPRTRSCRFTCIWRRWAAILKGCARAVLRGSARTPRG